MSNNVSSKKFAYIHFFTQTVQELIIELETLGPEVISLIETTDNFTDKNIMDISKYISMTDINVTLSRFTLDIKNNNINIFDDKIAEYYDKFVTLNPMDVFEIFKSDSTLYELVDPHIYNETFKSYQQKLINLEKSFREGEE